MSLTVSREPGRDLPRALTFFAAANTAGGFVNRFPALFGAGSGVGRLYVVGGGPGTGKSRFLHAAADYAAARGRQVIYLRCSSDPSSLDGVILSGPDGTIGLLDGTPPHGWELTRPGVREETVDLGAFWDAGRLSAQGAEIERLCRNKADAYAQAYRWLRACGEADRVVENLVLPLYDRDALQKRAEGLLRAALRRRRGNDAAGAVGDALLARLSPGGRLLPPLFRRAYGMTGAALLDTPEGCASRVVCLPDRTGAGAAFASCLLSVSERMGLPVLVTDDPLRPDRPDGLLWPSLGLCVLCGESRTAAAALHLHRYADAEGLRRVRGEVREACALRDSLTEAALGCLAKAGKAHFMLESLYTAAMDFGAKEVFTEAFCRRVFGA